MPRARQSREPCTVETEYDADGNAIAQVDGNKHASKYVRNALEQVVEATDPKGHKTLWEYDAAGNLTKLADAAKRTTTYTYDPANRLKEISYSDGKLMPWSTNTTKTYRPDHPPPHFHAQYGEEVAQIDLASLRILNGSVPPRALRLVRAWARLHVEELADNWMRAQALEPLAPIEPLP